MSKFKKNILLIFDGFQTGGILTINGHMFKIAADSGRYNLFVLCGVKNEVQKKYLEKFLFAKRIYSYQPKKTVFHILSFLETIRQTRKLVTQILKKERIDYVLFNHTYSALGAILSGKLKRNQTVSFFHGALYKEKELIYDHRKKTNILIALKWLFAKYPYRIAQQLMLSFSGKIICYSEYAKDLLKEAFNISDNIVDVTLPYIVKPEVKTKAAVALKRVISSNKSLVLLSLSRIEPRKGIHLIMEARKHLSKLTNIPIIILVIGPIQQKSQKYFLDIYNQAKPADENIKVYFRNEITDQNELYKYLKLADGVLMPSLSLETFGMVTMESLSFGVPVISLPTGATQEILVNIDNRLIARNTTGFALAEAIAWLARLKPMERKILQKKCMRYVRDHHSHQKCLSSLEKIFT